jgi:alkylation response protein AidB-like acyl-CoA dehydrogenase
MEVAEKPTAQVEKTEDAKAALQAAREIAPMVRELAPKSEELDTLAPEVVQAFRDANLFEALLPRDLGGRELDPLTLIELTEIIAAADGSAGWTLAFGFGGTGMLAWFDRDVAREMIGDDHDLAVTCSAIPTGTARPNGKGGYTVTGQWPFNSGCKHSKWLGGGVIILDKDGQPQMHPERGPDWRFCFFRNEPGRVLDTWHAMGMRATGSHDITLTEVDIPEEHFIVPFWEPAVGDTAWSRVSFMSGAIMYMSGVPLGIARNVLDEFVEMAPNKRRKGPESPSLAEDAYVQTELAKAEATFEAGRLFHREASAALWATANRGEDPSLDERALLRLAGRHTLEASVEAVDGVFELSGAHSLFTGNPMERAMRDLHSLTQHIYHSTEVWAQYSRNTFGIEQPTYDI